MAVPPDRQDWNERQAEIRSAHRRAYPGGGWFAWWWVWFLIIIGFIWLAGWGWHGYGGWWWGQPRAAAVQPLTTGSGVAVLTSDNKQAFIGQPFSLRDVSVQRKVNDRVMWIAANNTAPILVIVPKNANGNTNSNGAANAASAPAIVQGNRVNVTGTVEKAPPAAQAKRQWKLSDSGAQRLEQQGAYVEGSRVQKASNY